MRESRDKFFLSIAEAYAERSTCPRAHVGCVVVRDKRIVTSGYNGSLSGAPHCDEVGCDIGPDGGCIRTVHAEANTIAFAAKHGISLVDCTLFCTISPCYECSRLIVQSGITKVVFGNLYRMNELQVLKDSGVEVTQYGK